MRRLRGCIIISSDLINYVACDWVDLVGDLLKSEIWAAMEKPEGAEWRERVDQVGRSLLTFELVPYDYVREEE